MNLEVRKLNLINWISSIQEENVLAKLERLQREKTDWWDTVNEKDKMAINEGLKQLDDGQFLTRSQVRDKIKEKFSF